ncbi:MAG: hypothetical protein R6X17_06015 [Candidatus Competibacteraceae bacterium]
MRIVLLLIAAAVIGLTLTLTRWLGEPPAPARELPETPDPAAAPAVPTRPQDLPQFERDLNRFMEDAAGERRRQIDPP